MQFMDIAILEANRAYNKGEVPVGAIIVKGEAVIGVGHNAKESLKDVTRHAELIAIQAASRRLGDWRLNGCNMYVTLEPCIMCMGAIIQSRINKLYVGTFNKDMGACGTVVDLTNLKNKIQVEWLYDKRCSNLMEKFFQIKRADNKFSRLRK